MPETKTLSLLQQAENNIPPGATGNFGQLTSSAIFTGCVVNMSPIPMMVDGPNGPIVVPAYSSVRDMRNPVVTEFVTYIPPIVTPATNPCAPVESVIDSEMRAMHEWKQRVEAKRQPSLRDGLVGCWIFEQKRAPFPAPALFSNPVMKIGICYE